MIDIGIVTHNRPEFLQICLESIWANSPPDSYRLIIVDNSVGDEGATTQNYLYKNRDRFWRLLFNQTNNGWADACNEAIALMESEYVAIIGPDIVVQEGWMKLFDPLRHIKDLAFVGAISSKPIGDWRYQQVDYPEHGFSLGYRNNATVIQAIRLELLRELGGFQDFGSEYGQGADTDICLRAKDRGYKNALHLGVTVDHLPDTVGNDPAYHAERQRQRVIAMERFKKAHDWRNQQA